MGTIATRAGLSTVLKSPRALEGCLRLGQCPDEVSADEAGTEVDLPDDDSALNAGGSLDLIQAVTTYQLTQHVIGWARELSGVALEHLEPAVAQLIVRLTGAVITFDRGFHDRVHIRWWERLWFAHVLGLLRALGGVEPPLKIVPIQRDRKEPGCDIRTAILSFSEGAPRQAHRTPQQSPQAPTRLLCDEVRI